MKIKRWLVVGIAMAAFSGTLRGQALLPVPRVKTPFYVYSDRGTAKPGYDFAPSGWMGSVEALEIDICSDELPYHGPCCMKVTFHDPNNWAGIAWQNPAGNWGEEEGGLDITGARRLSFWARGQKGGETVEFSMGILGRDKTFYDTTGAKLGIVRLSKYWKQYSIPLEGKNLSRIVTGFVFSIKGRGGPTVFYLDDIIYE